jgi:hypothetical protein
MRWSRILGLTPGEFSWLVCGVALLAYELVAAANGRDGLDVLTRAWRANALRWTIWPVSLGILAGHLNGPVFAGFAGRYSPLLFIAVMAGALARDLFIRTPLPVEARLPLFLVGLVVGVVSWVGRP